MSSYEKSTNLDFFSKQWIMVTGEHAINDVFMAVFMAASVFNSIAPPAASPATVLTKKSW